MSRHARRAIGVLLAVAALPALTGCGLLDGSADGASRSDGPSASASASPEDGEPLVTREIALDVLADYDTANNEANDARSDDLISEIETGALLEIDLASYDASRALDEVREHENVPFSTADPVVALERTSTYPVRFLVVGRQDSDAAESEESTTIMQFLKVDASSDWVLEHVANVPGAQDVAVAVDADGYAEDVDDESLVADTEAVPPAAVTTLAGSDPGVPFSSSSGPTQVVEALEAPASSGIESTVTTADGQVVGTWALEDGGALVLGSMTATATYEPSAGRELAQPLTLDVWSSLLGSGTYATIDLDWVGLQAWVVPSATADDGDVTLLASYDGIVKAEGERTGDAPGGPTIDV